MSATLLTGRQCLCRGCGQAFNSVSAFDNHRIGPYIDRACLTVTELADRGWQVTEGFWRQPANEDHPFAGKQHA